MSHNDSIDRLLTRIGQAWPDRLPLRDEEIVAEWAVPFENKVAGYSSGRPLDHVDLSHRRINGAAVFHEAFTEKAKLYYAGVYLTYLLGAYAASPPRESDLAVGQFLYFLTHESARGVSFSREQALIIADALDLVADRKDLEFTSEEEVDRLLDAIRYWRDRTQSG